jgi:quinol-cytochrome oxidoreductase complex cytochrome b subunit
VLKIFGTLILSLVFWAGFLLLFQNNLIPVPVAPSAVGKWLADVFIRNSLIVVFVTFVATSLWFWISWRDRENAECHESVKYWWGLLMLPLITIGVITYSTYKDTGNATVYVIFSYVIHLIVIYWVGTSISSEGYAKYILPGSRAIRRLVSSVGIPL